MWTPRKLPPVGGFKFGGLILLCVLTPSWVFAREPDRAQDARTLIDQPLNIKCDLVRRILAHIPPTDHEEEGNLSIPLSVSSCARPEAYWKNKLIINVKVESSQEEELSLFKPSENCPGLDFLLLDEALSENTLSPPKQYVRLLLRKSIDPRTFDYRMTIGEVGTIRVSPCGECRGIAEKIYGGWKITSLRLDGTPFLPRSKKQAHRK